MKYRGINYDTGTKTLRGGLTREIFDPEVVAREIQIIHDELHCNAVRISGIDIGRVSQAAEVALKLGLTVWFSPSLNYDNQENTLVYMIQAAQAAERLRNEYEHLIFIIGCELTLFTSGFIKGETGQERMRNMFGPLSMIKNMLGLPRSYNRKLNIFFKGCR
jgi:hypothetical protein